jgi:hypothetical protein
MTTITYKGRKGKGRTRVLTTHGLSRGAEGKVVTANPPPSELEQAASLEHRNANRLREIAETHSKPRAVQWPHRKPRAPKKPANVGLDGPRMKEIKAALDWRSGEKRIARLVELIELHGSEKMEFELNVHERKCAEIRTALAIAERRNGSVEPIPC